MQILEERIYFSSRLFLIFSHNAVMHLIIDIRSTSPVDPIMTRYASSWVDLWSTRHPTDRISYLHYEQQDCPENGRSVVVSLSSWWSRKPLFSARWVNDIFRCVSFSTCPPYDNHIVTLSHIWDFAHILYPRYEKTLIDRLLSVHTKNRNRKWNTIIVPSLTIGQQTVELTHMAEEDIEIIPYITLTLIQAARHTLAQLSISGPYWIFDGSYGSESGIHGLLQGYKDYRDMGGSHLLLLMGRLSPNELRDISLRVQQLNLTGSVRIIGALDSEGIESLYLHASGWIYVGAYYTSGPRIELARSHHIPLLISDIDSLSDYHDWSLLIHPSHLGTLGNLLQQLEHSDKKENRKISNDTIMKKYEKIIAERR